MSIFTTFCELHLELGHDELRRRTIGTMSPILLADICTEVRCECVLRVDSLPKLLVGVFTDQIIGTGVINSDGSLTVHISDTDRLRLLKCSSATTITLTVKNPFRKES